jgi:hypothetical protein
MLEYNTIRLLLWLRWRVVAEVVVRSAVEVGVEVVVGGMSADRGENGGCGKDTEKKDFEDKEK